MPRVVKVLPSKGALCKQFSYDPLTGKFSHGYCLMNGYWAVSFKNEQYLVHRIIWKMMTGKDPEEIDHIDGDPSNNRWANLRNASSRQNNFNRRLSSRNTSGVKGVCWEKSRRKWRATIGADQGYGLLWLGRFDQLEGAAVAIEVKRRELCGEFARN